MYIHVTVKTNQKKEYIKKIKDLYFEVSVKEKPERNMANTRILEILHEYFDSRVRIVNGHQSPKKLVEIGD